MPLTAITRTGPFLQGLAQFTFIPSINNDLQQVETGLRLKATGEPRNHWRSGINSELAIALGEAGIEDQFQGEGEGALADLVLTDDDDAVARCDVEIREVRLLGSGHRSTSPVPWMRGSHLRRTEPGGSNLPAILAPLLPL
jgi:hypothetical protein